MRADHQAAIREIRRIKRQEPTNQGGATTVRKLRELENRLKESAAVRAWRERHRPKPVYDDSLGQAEISDSAATPANR